MPVVLRSGGGERPGAPEPTAPPAAAVVVPLGEGTGAEKRLRAGTGAVRDPFFDPPGGGAGEVVRSETPPAAVGPRTGGPRGGDEPGGPPVASPSRPPADTSPPVVGRTSPDSGRSPAPEPGRRPREPFYGDASVSVRVGPVGAARRREVGKRMTPLPSASAPFVVFEGVRRGTRTARLLVGGGVRVAGQGRCRPTPEHCRHVDLKAGDTQYFAVALEKGEVRWYRLDLMSLEIGGTAGS